MIVFVTSIIRRTPKTKSRGSILALDWKTKKNIFSQSDTFPEPFCYRNDNERGGARGWKGLLLLDKEIVVANNDCLVFYNLNMELKSIVTHPSLSGIHSIEKIGENRILIASTASDIIGIYEKNGFSFFDPLDNPIVENLISPYLRLRGRQHKTYNPRFDYRHEWREPVLHLNYVKQINNELFVYFNSMNILLKLSPNPEILWAPPLEEKLIVDMPLDYHGLNCPHDIVVETSNTLLLNSSRNQRLYRFFLDTKTLELVWQGDPKIEWTRGLSIVGKNKSVLIGTGIGSIIEVDLETGETLEDIEVAPSIQSDEFLPQSIFSIVTTSREDILEK